MPETLIIENGTPGRRWWARAAFALAFLAVVVPVLFAGLLSTMGILLIGVGGAVVFAAALYWFLAGRGSLRWAALAVAVLAPLTVFVFFIRANLLAVVIAALALAALATACARAALRRKASDEVMLEIPATPPSHPFLIMNPRSGGGKATRFDLQHKAEKLGAEVVLLDETNFSAVDELARRAVMNGADLLGVAGGDGTQARVAAVAAEFRVPFMVISAGTRNHFAMDLGLDRDDPTRCLDALRDGVDIRIDLGRINGRAFVNNASFGVYAEVVRSPAYRDDKTRTVLKMLPDLLAGQSGPNLVAQIGDVTVRSPQAVLVSNNRYGGSDLAGMSRRDRLDRGLLGVVTVSVAGAGQAVSLLRRTHARGLTQHETSEVIIDADTAEISVGVDGESLLLTTPVRCTIEPGALRVRVPRERPGTKPSPPPVDWVRLRALARFGSAPRPDGRPE
ncbi:diacylglycerol/lipid kinase family protein [Rhodococcus sp. SJ-3]|uniref:diacylglycerol/lipid kinase family protein n=1 Tax=Rhodococcus sp. SJ-3 TaxID=3454628 RepID=UPI003F790ABC